MNVLPPLCTILCHLWLQIQLLHVVFNTFQPYHSWPSSATFPFHLNISAGTYPLLPYHTLHMSKPTQSTSPHHLHYTLNTQTRAKVLTPLPIGQLHPTHPSYHLYLIALHTNIRSLHEIVNHLNPWS